MRPFIFFSYSRRDADFVLQLGKDLRGAGIDIWLDQLDIKPGERWDVAIEATLADCGQLLAVLSPASVTSTNVLDEVSYALESGKRVIPVLFQDCEIPFRLRRLQHLDFRSDYNAALNRLVEYLTTHPAPARDSKSDTSDDRDSMESPSLTPPPVPRATNATPVYGVAGSARAGFSRGTLALGAVAGAVVVLGAVFAVQRAATPRPSPSKERMALVPNELPAHSAVQATTNPTTTAVTPVPQPTPVAQPTAAPQPTPVAQPPAPAGFQPGRAHIVNVHSGLCLTVAGGARETNVSLVQFPCDGDRSRVWNISEVAGTSFVSIKNLNSELCATIAGAGTERNTSAVQYACDDHPARRWKVVSSPVRGVQLVNAHSKLCLTVAGGGTERNTTAVQFLCDGDPSRDWEIRPAPTAKINKLAVHKL